MEANWPAAVAMAISSICGVLTVWQQLQNKAMRARITVLEQEHRDCHELLGQKWPSDATDLVAAAAQLQASLALEGEFVTLRHAALILRHKQRPKPA